MVKAVSVLGKGSICSWWRLQLYVVEAATTEVVIVAVAVRGLRGACPGAETVRYTGCARCARVRPGVASALAWSSVAPLQPGKGA